MQFHTLNDYQAQRYRAMRFIEEPGDDVSLAPYVDSAGDTLDERNLDMVNVTFGSRLRRTLVVTAVAGFAGPALAASYVQTQGEGYTVCEAFGRHLEERTEENPMVCEVELDPRYDGFSRPEWKELSLEDPENLALFRKLDQVARERERSPANDHAYVGELTEEEWRKDFRWRQQQEHIGEPRLLKAKLGLDGKGEDEKVLATSWGSEECRAQFEAGEIGVRGEGPHTFFIYNEAEKRVNLKLTDGPIRYTSYKRFDPLIYQGRAFLVTTHYRPERRSIVWVTIYGMYGGRGAAVNRCEFEMDLSPNSGTK